MEDSLNNKIKAILFDLDGTLLDVDLDKFISHYLRLLAESVAHIIPPKKFINKIIKASQEVEKNDGRRTNEDVYLEAFFPVEGYCREEIEPFFNEFYKKNFSKLRQYTKRKPEAREVVQTAFDKGNDVVIATTPLLPATAIEQRLEWAEQILDKISRPANACLMVGDEEKDLISKRLGMKTFFIEGKNLEIANGIPEPTYKGSLADLIYLL